MKKRISSVDVAREAGVSRATVSYILNNVKDVKIRPETREKVLKAAKKLGYHPDSSARALKTNRSMSIGIVSQRDVTEERFVHVLRGVQEILGKHKYNIVLCSDDTDRQGNPEYFSYYQSRKIDGVILLSRQENINTKPVEIITKHSIPAVFVDYHLGNPILNCVDINYFHGGYLAAKHLIEKGHKRIIYLSPRFDNIQETQRLNGVKQAFEESGMSSDSIRIIDLDENQLNGDNISSILKNKKDNTAMIVSWVQLAFKVLYYANSLKIKVPEDFAVISLAGSSFSNYTYPRLSTCDLPSRELGKKSAEALMSFINGESIPVNMSLPCTLNVKETT